MKQAFSREWVVVRGREGDASGGNNSTSKNVQMGKLVLALSTSKLSPLDKNRMANLGPWAIFGQVPVCFMPGE